MVIWGGVGNNPPFIFNSLGTGGRLCVQSQAPMALSAFSRKTHGAVGSFDIQLPLTGTPGIECRSGGANDDYQVVFVFPNAVTLDDAAITAGAGSVSGFSGSGTATVIVNLTAVASGQRITVALFGVNNGNSTGDVAVQMGVLLGDTNGSGSVNAGDIAQTKSESGQTTDAFNFRSDVTVSGSINAADISLVKSKTGTGCPNLCNIVTVRDTRTDDVPFSPAQ